MQFKTEETFTAPLLNYTYRTRSCKPPARGGLADKCEKDMGAAYTKGVAFLHSCKPPPPTLRPDDGLTENLNPLLTFQMMFHVEKYIFVGLETKMHMV